MPPNFSALLFCGTGLATPLMDLRGAPKEEFVGRGGARQHAQYCYSQHPCQGFLSQCASQILGATALP